MNNYIWKQLNFGIVGYNENITKTTNSNITKICIFDLDNTIIKTKSGNVFPKNLNDWIFLFDNTVKTLNQENIIYGIVSNQSGLKTENKKNDWITKLNDIIKFIPIHFVFASTGNNEYRKPLPNSWYYIKEHILFNVNVMELERDNKIYYIGDACGRTNDFSDSDLKYALNLKFKFKTPEKYFLKTKNEIMNISYPKLEYYTENEFDEIVNKILNEILNSINLKIIIVMVGFPASGKTFLRKKLIELNNNIKYFNNDDINNRVKSDNLIEIIENKYDYIINDNTNLLLKHRIDITNLNDLKEHYKLCIHFNYSMDILNHLNYHRMYYGKQNLLSSIVYRTMNSKITENDKKFNDFDGIIEINKIFPQIKNDIEYLF